MEKDKIIDKNDLKDQPEKTNKYFYMEAITVLLIAFFLINDIYSDYIYRYEYCSKVYNDCYQDIPHAWRESSMLSLLICMLVSRVYFRKIFSYSKGKLFLSFILPLMLSFYLFWGINLDGVAAPRGKRVPPDLYLAILLPLFLSILLDRILIKKDRSSILYTNKREVLNKLFIPTMILLSIWTISLFLTINEGLYFYL